MLVEQLPAGRQRLIKGFRRKPALAKMFATAHNADRDVLLARADAAPAHGPCEFDVAEVLKAAKAERLPKQPPVQQVRPAHD